MKNKNDQWGSKLRCSLLALSSRNKTIGFFNELIKLQGKVENSDVWQPSSKSHVETTLTNLDDFLDCNSYNINKDLLKQWWLVEGHRLGQWDFVCSFSPNCPDINRKGLILVEAKANFFEFNKKRDKSDSKEKTPNWEKIKGALSEASANLNNVCSPEGPDHFALSIDKKYQLSNRFAFSWRLAYEGIPVVLIYLGFLNAAELDNFFKSHEEWENCVKEGSAGIIPPAVWNKTFDVTNKKDSKTPLSFLIRSAKVDINASFQSSPYEK